MFLTDVFPTPGASTLTEMPVEDANDVSLDTFKHFVMKYFPPKMFIKGNKYEFHVDSSGEKITFINVDTKKEFVYDLPQRSRQFFVIAASRSVLNPFTA